MTSRRVQSIENTVLKTEIWKSDDGKNQQQQSQLETMEANQKTEIKKVLEFNHENIIQLVRLEVWKSALSNECAQCSLDQPPTI